LKFLLAHQTEGRTRLRAALRPVDEVELGGVAGALAQLPGVEAVDARPATGSLVIEHPEVAWDELAADIGRLGGVILAAPGEPRIRRDSLAPVRSGAAQVDNLLGAVTAGGLDIRSLVFVVLVALALRQFWQGQVMVPGISLLWWAFDLVRDQGPPAGDGADAPAD
jgi:hypothetical protein